MSNRIAMVGMYGGMWKEFNPGCFMTGLKTYKELLKINGSKVDIYSIDNKMKGKVLLREDCYGLPITFFSRDIQLDLLENTLSEYDTVVIGGDIVWGGDDVVDDNDIFFARSEKFLSNKSPNLIINCVHTFYDDLEIKNVSKRFIDVCKRADYVSVRTAAIERRLRSIGIENTVHVPDLALGLDPVILRAPKDRGHSKKLRIGLSVRSKLSTEMISLLEQPFWDDYELVVWPFSRQYYCLETVQKIKEQFGDRFQYIEKYHPPNYSFGMMRNFDLSINDTYHGTIAAILAGTPFISLDVEKEVTSRKDQLLRDLDVDVSSNIRLSSDSTSNTEVLKREISKKILERSLEKTPIALNEVRDRISRHFGKIRALISNN